MKLASLILALLTANTALHAQPLSVAITRTPTNLSAFYLDVLNMTPGATYGVGGKVTPDNDPFNTWTLLDVFAAPAPAVRYEVAATFPQRTYAAMNLDNYVGPSVRILSPAPASIVSGDVPVQVLVADILPLYSVEVFVGPTLAGVIRPRQGGVMKLPTQAFPNGEQQIWVRAVNEGLPVDSDGDGVPDSPSAFASWESVTVTFSNDVFMENFSPLYSAYGLSYFALTPHDYTFEVFRLNGELLHSQSGTINGSLSPQWNFTDLLGNPVDDAGYIFSLTATPAEGGQMAMMSQSSSTDTSSTTDYVPATSIQPQKFQNFSSGELLLVESGTSLSEITKPESKLTDEDIAAALAKLAMLEPTGPPPLPASPPWPPKLPSGYAAATMNGPAAAGGLLIKTTSFFDKGVTVGKYVISYGEWPNSGINDWNDVMNDGISMRVNVAAFSDPGIIGENRYTHSPPQADFTADPYMIKKATQTNDLVAMTNALADLDVGSWLWNGHSSAEDMIPGTDGHLTVRLYARDLAALLGNRFEPGFALITNIVYTKRFFSTFNIGCYAVNGVWPLVTGTPPGVQQDGNALIKKSAFIGFSGQSFTGGTKVGWINELHSIWIDYADYNTPLSDAFNNASAIYPAVISWGAALIGFSPLRYDGFDSF